MALLASGRVLEDVTILTQSVNTVVDITLGLRFSREESVADLADAPTLPKPTQSHSGWAGLTIEEQDYIKEVADALLAIHIRCTKAR